MECEVYDLERICRSCRQQSHNQQSIFTCVGTNGITLLEMLSSFTHIQIHFNDEMPRNICGTCVSDVTAAYTFRKQYEQSDRLLREYISRRRLNEDRGPMSIKMEIVEIKPEIGFIDADPFGAPASVQTSSAEPRTRKKPSKLDLDSDGDDDDYVPDDKFEACGSDSDSEVGEIEQVTVDADVTFSSDEEPLIKFAKGKLEASCKICDTTYSRIIDLKNHLLVHGDTKCFPNIDLEHKSYLFENLQVVDCYKEHLSQKVREGEVARFYQIVRTDGEELTLSDSDSEVEVGASIEGLNRRKHECGFCSKTFSRLKMIMKHATDSHSSDDLKECTYCNKRFPNNKLLERHLKRQCENCDKRVVCNICNERFQWQSSLEMHTKRKHKSVESKADVSNNEQDGPKKYSCEICDRSFLRQWHLLRHAAAHDPSIGKKYKCGQCEKQFNRRDHYQSHLSIHKDGEVEIEETKEDRKEASKPKDCTVCGRTFVRDWHLVRHLKSHEDDIQCDHCDGKFSTMFYERYKEHMATEHPDKEVKPMIFPEIKKQSNEGSGELAADSSVSVDGKEQKFVCPICGKEFNRSQHLARHTKIHNPSEVKFECTVCQKKFNRKDNLRLHMKIHFKDPSDTTNKANHLCIYCGRGFASSYNLTVHMRRHTGDKPYKCDICGKGFPRSLDLKTHRRTHTGEKPYVCTICGKAFSRSHRLGRHMR
ncbi:zinc finger protein ZFP2-like, partial [Uranotaenia lowii]|uniref:zinc finger protein ZFP2-like n=1 Tax=Uranotaenia lowii TaxID=190385 RepID=UPI0024793B4B